MGLFSFLFKKKESEVKKDAPKQVAKPEVIAEPKTASKPKLAEPKVASAPKKAAEPKATAEPKKPAEPKKAVEPKVAAEPKVVAKPEALDVAAEENDINDAETETVTESKPTRSGRFDIKRTKDNRFVFNLYSSNQVLIATSQIYSSSQAAMNGVKSVMANAKEAEIEDTTLKTVVPRSFPKWEIYIDKAGEYRYRLLATNGQCITHAKAGYAHKSSCKRAIESIVRLACDANVDKSYRSK